MTSMTIWSATTRNVKRQKWRRSKIEAKFIQELKLSCDLRLKKKIIVESEALRERM